MQVYNDEQLYHFGVKGMKWGRRKNSITKTKSEIRTDRINKGKKIVTNVTRFAVSSATKQMLKKHTNIGSEKQKVLGILSGEIGSLAVGKALKMDSKELTKQTAVRTTQTSLFTASNKILKDNTNLDPFKRTMISITIGGIGAGAVGKVLETYNK